MDPLKTTTAGPDIPGTEQRRPVEKKVARFTHKLQPGQKLWEMIVYTIGGQPAKGWSKDPETGQDLFDPELAEVREVKTEGATVVFGDRLVQGLGQVKPGTTKKASAVPGNFYWPAINAATARKKIIRNFFT